MLVPPRNHRVLRAPAVSLWSTTDFGEDSSNHRSAQLTNASDLRSFLGTVGFSTRLIPDFSTTAEPLCRLTHKGTPFFWTDTHQRAFDRLCQQLGDAAALAYYDKDAPTQVIAGASPVGLGAVLVQEQNGQRRAVCYASRTLTPVERRYSQADKEALALVWSCDRFHQFLYGMDFELVTDHKTLQTIYSPTSKPSARIERAGFFDSSRSPAEFATFPAHRTLRTPSHDSQLTTCLQTTPARQPPKNPSIP